jgi:membrane protein DedA with SNARE-associated domain
MIAILVGLALSTLISEDLASIGAGLLAREGHVPLIAAIVACIVGVYAGDLGLWGIGRVCASHWTRFAWLSRAFASADVAVMRSRVETRLGTAILVSRFLPGSRLPMYVAMGAWGQRPLAFAGWSLIAVVAWTPLLVIATLHLGDAVVVHAVTGIRAGVLGSLATAAIVFAAMKLTGRGLARLTRHYHQRLAQTIETPNWSSTTGTFQRRTAV